MENKVNNTGTALARSFAAHAIRVYKKGSCFNSTGGVSHNPAEVNACIKRCWKQAISRGYIL